LAPPLNRYLKSNRRAWDEMARIHSSGTPGYPVDRVKKGRSGWGTLPPDDLGQVRGKSILHLQCHFGMDSLMWAAKGARVTGVDFSPVAVAAARDLSRRSGIQARFIESDIASLDGKLRQKFDIVLTYCGVLCWLPDLGSWARTIARHLKPGGFFYVADAHPVANMLEFDRSDGTPRFAYSYFPSGVERFVSTGGTYSAPDAPTKSRVSYEWHHSLAEITGSLRAAGLDLEYLHEFPYLFYEMTYYTKKKLMRCDRRGRWRLKGFEKTLPLMFSVRARMSGRN
jgi:SAM-dependent methyltransferase